MKLTSYDIIYALLGLEGLGMILLAFIGIAQDALLGFLVFLPSAIFLIRRYQWQSTSEKNIVQDERMTMSKAVK